MALGAEEGGTKCCSIEPNESNVSKMLRAHLTILNYLIFPGTISKLKSAPPYNEEILYLFIAWDYFNKK